MTALLPLINEVLRRTGQAEVDTLTNAPTPVVQAIDYLNETYVEMLQRLNVRRLVKQASFNTVNGTTAYTLANDVDMDAIQVDAILELGNKALLSEVDATYPLTHGVNQTGQPAYFYRLDNRLYLYPIPNGVYTIQYQYLAKAQKLSLDADTTILPEDWEKVLILGTQARLEKFLGENGTDTYLLYRDGLSQLKSRAPLKNTYRFRGFYRGARSV